MRLPWKHGVFSRPIFVTVPALEITLLSCCSPSLHLACSLVCPFQ